jgi:hypothetical protein
LNQREAKGAPGTTLIPYSDYLFPMMQQVTVFKNLSLPLILGIDAIENSGITYLSRTKSFMFQEELHTEKFQKADLRVICTLKIPANSSLIGRNNWPCQADKEQCQQLQAWRTTVHCSRCQRKISAFELW